MQVYCDEYAELNQHNRWADWTTYYELVLPLTLQTQENDDGFQETLLTGFWKHLFNI